MAEQPNARPEAAPVKSTEKPSNPARRRWLQAGLSAPPVLMTVVSRPVLGATQFCVPPSAYVSLPTSTPGMYGDCTGNGPAAWLNTDPWPSPYCRGPAACGPGIVASRFNAYFSPSLQGNPLFLEVLAPAFSNQVARYIVAALLNTAAPAKVPASVLSAAAVKDIWTSTNGGLLPFVPSPGASWDAAEIIDYLKSTMVSA